MSLKNRLDSKEELISFSITSIVILLIFQIVYGLSILLPNNINWLMSVHGDWGCYYLGSAFYRNEPWGFPLGSIQTYGYPVVNNVSMTDGVPLLAILIKVFSFFLPQTFQLYGIWLLLNHLLLAFFSLKIFKLFNLTKSISILGAIIVAVNPVIITRGMHCALASHWLLLAAIYYYIIPTSPVNLSRVNYKRSFLLFFTAFINIYLTVMVVGISLVTTIKQCFFEKTLFAKKGIVISTLQILLVAIAWLLTGVISLSGSSSNLSLVYGQYSSNLNSFFNSFGLSSFLPALRVISSDQGEGYAYLGIGFILLIAICFVYLVPRLFKSPISGKFARYYYLIPIALLSIAYLLFSYSNTITFSDQKLIQIPLPIYLEKIFSVFRGNGRFIWLTYYLIILSSIILYSKAQISKPFLNALFLVVAVIQFYDIIPCLNQYKDRIADRVGDYQTPLKDSKWISLIPNFDAVITYPPFERSIDYEMDYQDLAFLALKARRPISTAYYARTNDIENRKFFEKIVAQIDNGKFNENYLFVTKQPVAFKNLINSGSYDLKKLDNYYCIFIKNSSLSHSFFESDKNALASIDSLKNAMSSVFLIEFPSEAHYLYNTTVVTPIWGDAFVSSTTFKINSGDYILDFSSFGTVAKEDFPIVEVSVNDAIIGEFTVNSDYKEYQIPYSASKDMEAVLRLRLKNDFQIPGKEDRNAFVRWIHVTKPN